MRQFNFDLSNALAGSSLMETAKEFVEAKSGIYSLDSVEIHEKANEETGEISKSLRVNFRSISNEKIVKTDYFRTRQADALIKGLLRFRYLTKHAEKPELLNDMPFPIQVLGSYSSKDKNEGVLKQAQEEHKVSVSNVFADELFKAISNKDIVNAIKASIGEDDILICTVANADAYLNKLQSVANELKGTEYHVTISDKDDNGYTNITKYKQA